eukprot:3722014-Rhodomonas_salina.3
MLVMMLSTLVRVTVLDTEDEGRLGHVTGSRGRRYPPLPGYYRYYRGPGSTHGDCGVPGTRVPGYMYPGTLLSACNTVISNISPGG